MSRPQIALVGNGPYANRGCEAIVRGTMEIIRSIYERVEVTLGSFGRAELIARQRQQETDPWIRHFPLLNRQKVARWTFPWFRHQIMKLFGRSGALDYKGLREHCSDADVVLQIGGDNYSLDYGIPYNFMALDRWFFSRNVPVVLWGASVGPFDRLPEFKTKMLEHLKRMDLILVRESESFEYLAANGVIKNVEIMPDPAFLLNPRKPSVKCVPRGEAGELVGISLSPLMARFVTNGDLAEWTRLSATIVKELLRSIPDRFVMLVPHVINEFDVWSDDLTFLRNVVSLLTPQQARRIVVLPPLCAAEYKWLIGQCKVFVGARTHSTIASLSQCIPTVSLAYSVKAVGLNRDLLGTLEYCIMPGDLSPGSVAERVRHALSHYSDLRRKLQDTIPRVIKDAKNAGAHLKRIIEKP